jgi:hypothetical protein
VTGAGCMMSIYNYVITEDVNVVIINDLVQSTPHLTIHFGHCTALISWALALMSNCKCKARRAVDQNLTLKKT